MSDDDARIAILRAYSEARVTRADVAAVFGQPISFGELLMLLGEQDLPLPRFPTDPDSPGRVLLRRLLAQQSDPRGG
jgi:hypothetical protein